jgi:zinc transporter
VTADALKFSHPSSGLICGYLIDPTSEAREIECEDASAWLRARVAAQRTPSTFVWLHFNLTDNGALSWLRSHAGLGDDFYALLESASHATRIERSDESLVAVINDVHFDFSFEPSDISTLWISVEEHLVVTARRRPLRSIDKLRESVKAGHALGSSIELLEYLLHLQAEVLAEVIRGVTSKIDEIEDDLLSERPVRERRRLGGLRRLLVRLQRLLAPEPASLFRLLQHPPAWIATTDADELRQTSEEFSLVLRDMGMLQERIKLLQEESAALVNEGNNRSLYILTVVTVLALPINIVAGLMGMNVGGVPLAQHAHGFWIVLSTVVSITALAGWIAFRHRDRKSTDAPPKRRGVTLDGLR